MAISIPMRRMMIILSVTIIFIVLVTLLFSLANLVGLSFPSVVYTITEIVVAAATVGLLYAIFLEDIPKKQIWKGGAFEK